MTNPVLKRGGLKPGASKPRLQASASRRWLSLVQALLLLTRHLPLKEAFVLLTIIPEGILILFYT